MMKVEVGDYVRRKKDGNIMRVTKDEEATLYVDNYRIGVTDANFYLENNAVEKIQLEKVTFDYLQKHCNEWLRAVIVFEDSILKSSNIEQRSFLVSSDEKFFNPEMIGNSLYATSLDSKTNEIVRIDRLVYSGSIDYCYVMKWKPIEKRLPIVLSRFKEEKLSQEETEEQIMKMIKEIAK